MTDEEKFMTNYRRKEPMTLARKIENVFSFLYKVPDGDMCHFDKGLLDEIKAAALRGCAAVPEGRDSIIEECARVCNQSFFINGREVGTTPVHHLIQDAIRDLKGKSMNSQR